MKNLEKFLNDNSAFLDSVKSRCVYAIKHGEKLTPELVGDAMLHTLGMQRELLEGKTDRSKNILEKMARDIWESFQK